MLVRTWNLNRGNSVPGGRANHVRAMVELIATGAPDVVCLQDVPAWALPAVGGWAGMQAIPVRAQGPRLGPLPVAAAVGHVLASPHSGLLERVFAGRGNVVLVRPDAAVRAVKTVTLNTNVFCEERGAELGLSPKQMRAWERERRVCHLVQYELPSRRRVLAATLHATLNPADPRLADAELRRATSFIDRRSEVEETVILAGDFNITREQSETIRALEGLAAEARWADDGHHVDHVLVRGSAATAARVWTPAERTHAGRLLSDHYPIEVELPFRGEA